MIKFLTPSRRGPGPGLCVTVDGYPMDIAWTGTLRLRIRPCHEYRIFISSIDMYFMAFYVHKCVIR